MSRRAAEMHRRSRSTCCWLACIACVMLVAAACAPPPEKEPPDKPPAEEREEVVTGSIEPKETSGAPYPPAELDEEFIPNVEEEKWEPVPDGPVHGDLEPANPPVEIKEAEIEREPKDKTEKEEG